MTRELLKITIADAIEAITAGILTTAQCRAVAEDNEADFALARWADTRPSFRRREDAILARGKRV